MEGGENEIAAQVANPFYKVKGRREGGVPNLQYMWPVSGRLFFQEEGAYDPAVQVAGEWPIFHKRVGGRICSTSG